MSQEWRKQKPKKSLYWKSRSFSGYTQFHRLSHPISQQLKISIDKIPLLKNEYLEQGMELELHDDKCGYYKGKLEDEVHILSTKGKHKRNFICTTGKLHKIHHKGYEILSCQFFGGRHQCHGTIMPIGKKEIVLKVLKKCTKHVSNVIKKTDNVSRDWNFPVMFLCNNGPK